MHTSVEGSRLSYHIHGRSIQRGLMLIYSRLVPSSPTSSTKALFRTTPWLRALDLQKPPHRKRSHLAVRNCGANINKSKIRPWPSMDTNPQ